MPPFSYKDQDQNSVLTLYVKSEKDLFQIIWISASGNSLIQR